MRYVIPTIVEKREWLKRTLWGLSLQNDIFDARMIILVDVKPWDGDDLGLGDLPEGCEVTYVTPAASIKRQHVIVNEAMEALDDRDAPVCVMDDDYWALSTLSMGRLLSSWRPGRIVTPSWYWSSPGKIELPSGEYSCRGDGLSYCDLENPVRRSFAAGEHGMHPMCGNPKLVSPETWSSVGGFPEGYRHYWFADTELYVRSRGLIDQIDDVDFAHAEHERHRPEMFAAHNARLFMSRVGKDLPSSDQHRQKAEDAIG
jgi:hypothetical protein